MLHVLNQCLEAFFRSEVPLPSADVDVSFQTPDSEWSSKLTRPTVSLYLHEVRRSPQRAVTGTVTRNVNGVHTRDMLAPFIRVRYAISVWTNEATDEHRVLGSLLSLVATAGSLPPAFLQSPLDQLGNNVELTLAGDDSQTGFSLWGALGVPPRAAVELIVVLPVSSPATRVVPAPPTSVGLGVADRHNAAAASSVQQSLNDEGALKASRGRRRGRTMVEEG